MDAVNHLLRRSRLRSFAVAAHRALPFFPDEDDIGSINAENELRKRLTPEQLESMQSSAKASAIRAASDEAAARQAAQTVLTTARVTPTTAAAATHGTYSFGDKFGHVTSTSTAPSISSASAVRSSAPSSAVRAVTSSSSSSSSSTTRSTTPSVAPTTSTATVRTITQTPSTTPTSAAASASASASIAASNNSSKSEGMSTGAIAGIVVAVLVGIVIVGSAIGWCYRKYAQRSYSTKAPWSKIEDDDVTPFPANEKYGRDDDDIYGASSAPVIGSRRALALARQNAFVEDGSFRPDSSYMIERGDNRAGVGSGHATNNMYGAYPNLPSPYYGTDPQGRPYPDHGRAPMPHMYHDVPSDSPHAISAPGNTRQLVGPNGFPQPELSPHALGRPAAPSSNFAIAQHEDFADMPEPHTPTNMDDEMAYTPRTATTMGEWAGDARAPQNRSRVSMNTPRGGAPVDLLASSRDSPTEMLRPEPAAFPVAAPAPSTLPSFEPMSPLMSGFDLRRQSSQPLAMYEDEKAQQKRMYGEVASTAGVPEPPTPKSALNDSTSTYETTSSFSAHDPMPRLPSLTVDPPRPYEHGRPLSPLTEMPTPMSTATGRTLEPNPYERSLLSAQRSPAPPYSASTTGATAFPSPAYPPPSPGGMSVPGSVTDSPQRWENRAMRQSFDGEDAYGGI